MQSLSVLLCIIASHLLQASSMLVVQSCVSVSEGYRMGLVKVYMVVSMLLHHLLSQSEWMALLVAAPALVAYACKQLYCTCT